MTSKKNFLFTSAGDNTNFDSLWINDNMNYDIYVIYYGNNNDIYEKYKSKVTFIEKRKGSKFQNFKYFYDNNIDIINSYERYFILDDDIIFNVDDINNMFEISEQYNLDICGPSFTRDSKLSHAITIHKPNILLTCVGLSSTPSGFLTVNVKLYTVVVPGSSCQAIAAPKSPNTKSATLSFSNSNMNSSPSSKLVVSGSITV